MTDDPHRHRVLRLPSARQLARHAVPNLVESTVGPGVVFYVVLLCAGFRGAVAAALAWSYAALARRLARRERVSGMLLMATAVLTVRTVVAFATGSALLYFIQPSVTTFAVGLLFAASAAARRPFIERLARDFCPLDDEAMASGHMRAFFLRMSLLWAVLLTVSAAASTWLLVVSSVGAFVVERTAVSDALIGGGVAVSVWWFVRSMRREGIRVAFGSAGTPNPA